MFTWNSMQLEKGLVYFALPAMNQKTVKFHGTEMHGNENWQRI